MFWQIFLISSLLLMIFDVSWFQYSVDRFYKAMFESIQNKPWSVRPMSAIVVWLLMGLFITLQLKYCPAQPEWLFYVYGFIIYGVYNMTNHVVFKDYDLRVAFVDTLWGTVLMGTVARLVKSITKTF
jgi:uncharacterized membrane protein